ncbi:hypothetical protein N7462_003141 [Penicillium macrosclerotiorum]|uniref:uncharacterized protein n=1 Tax=Penicillium macrosclerotiorum TaxID=303699 RepID=UPI00254826B6|nr:uncharacterized protein N7462_003141 [Penicillium macrosclerotiorum]KAJ5688749.1 hypothetical protein N7462_003141 [Penicillium macrosclerotiorum]
MQMEPWRQRGFVPDSDEEDDLDSLNTTKGLHYDADDDVDLEYIPLPPSAEKIGATDDVKEQHAATENGRKLTRSSSYKEVQSHGDNSQEVVNLVSSPVVANGRFKKQRQPHEESPKGASSHATLISPARQAMKPRRATKTYGKRSSSTKTTPQDSNTVSLAPNPPDDSIWDLPSSPVTQLRRGRKARSHESTPHTPATPLILGSEDLERHESAALQLTGEAGRSRSSSPDELVVISRHVSTPKNGDHNLPIDDALHQESLDDSPLSSPPSSLHSPHQTSDDEGDATPTVPAAGLMTQTMLDLQIPQNLLEQMVQPMRRTFRQRNAIQLHPYALEMAKYQKQMKDGGVRPVRMLLEAQRQKQNENTDESQEKDTFNPDAARSSPPQEEYLPPVRPERRQERESAKEDRQTLENHDMLMRRNLSYKRRKKSYSGSWQPTAQSSENRERPQVVIRTDKPSTEHQALSVFDIPSSPPHSGSLPSFSRTPRVSEGFRFPIGFTPPPTTTTGVQSKPATPGVIDEPDDDDDDDDETLRSAGGSNEDLHSDASQDSLVNINETPEEREIRAIQRRTRGVLPASWVRLNAQKSEKQNSIRHNRHGVPVRTDGKGVAKKIVRRARHSGNITPQANRALFDLGDSDESDDENPGPGNANPENVGEDEKLLERVEFEDSFDPDGDILEDNRIDYMLAPISRNAGSGGKRKGLKRGKLKENKGQTERRIKKARLHRQTRLTDASYGGQRTKQSSRRSTPRLGILDAPDVTDMPLQEQPQFLRIAARGARSRQDQGRRSPTRKFLKLSSKLDTADANESLRNWTSGAIPKAKTSRPQPKPWQRRSLANVYMANRRAIPAARTSSISTHFPSVKASFIPDDDVQIEVSATPAEGSEASPSSPVPPATTGGPRQSIQSERQGQQWIVRRNMGVTSLQRSEARPAASSLVGFTENQPRSQDLFRKSLTLLNRDYRNKYSSQSFKPSLTLNRYLSSAGSVPSSRGASNHSAAASAQAVNRISTSQPNQPQQNRRRLKKNTPRHINLEPDGFIQDQEPRSRARDGYGSLAVTQVRSTQASSFSVGGLFNWQRSYSIDLGTSSLPDGTFFHESTFIGSGEFYQALHVLKRDLDKHAGFALVPVKDRQYQWAAWNEMTSSEFGLAFQSMVEDTERSVASLPRTNSASKTLTSTSLTYRSMIVYVTSHLSFTDPVDRTSFVTRAIGQLGLLRDSMASFVTGSEHNKRGLARVAGLSLVFSNQIRQISSHSFVSPTLADEAFNLVKAFAADVIALVLSEEGIADLQRLFEQLDKAELREAGIREDFPYVEAYVVVEQLLRSSEVYNGVFNDLQAEACTKRLLRNAKDVAGIEKMWRGLFALLPFSDIDNHGISRRMTRFKNVHDNWAPVQKLLSPALDNYGTNSASQPIQYNSYCRALFQRCHYLINVWGWRESKPILDTLYDFFAHNTLHNLKLEESRGSPLFLDELDLNPSLDTRPGEPCFHTLLKILGSGLRFLSKRYNNKKLLNFIWRLLPNHGRVYPKEMNLRHEDLDALRNHHDLLCTLYWAVPDPARPPLKAIRDLVHPAKSHRETCSINLRSWARLVRFKLSTDEDISGLEPFADWHSYFVSELRQQHTNARKDIEAQSQTGERFSQQHVENAISQNQRSIESLLSTALAGMQTAIEKAQTLQHAHRLISKTPFESLLGLFNPKLARVNSVVSEALNVMIAYVQKDDAASPGVMTTAPAAAESTEEDSQEFGDIDWTEELDDALLQESPRSEAIEHVQKVLHPAVSRLVSNCFGEDHCPDDAILTNVIDCWTSIAQLLVRYRLKQWDNYLDYHSVESWASLRETIQTRKFAPQFVAACIEKDARIILNCRILVMSMWISSLAERSSMLKFQHQLTEALLNGNPDDPLLHNLPFIKDKKSGLYSITPLEFNQRQSSVISSVLSNMRDHVSRLELSDSRELNATKQEYSELLQKLMSAMRRNYQELGNGDVESAQGAYVDFVHRIIRFLQELTTDIRPVDSFFTDHALFPLPSSDPRYIVAKLKRYESKLSSHKELQTLTVFIQNITERATIDGQQDHLADQLHTAMKDSYEAGHPNKLTLRAGLLQCVFPAYLELVFSNPAAWLLSRPVLKSISLVFKDLLFNLDTTDPACVTSLLRVFNGVFQSSHRALSAFSARPSCLKSPIVLLMLAAFIEIISSSLMVIDYVDRATDTADGLIFYIEWFRDFAVSVTSFLTDSNMHPSSIASITAVLPPDLPATDLSFEMPQYLTTARRLAFEEHKSCLKHWSCHEGKYYYTRPGHGSKEVCVESELAAVIENMNSAQKIFEETTADFVDRIERLNLLLV